MFQCINKPDRENTYLNTGALAPLIAALAQ